VKRFSLVLLFAAAAFCYFILSRRAPAPPMRQADPVPTPSKRDSNVLRPFRVRTFKPLSEPQPSVPSPFRTTSSGVAEMDVEARMALNDQLLAMPAPLLVEAWQEEARKKDDPLRLDFVGNALSFRLRDRDESLARSYDQLALYLNDPANDVFLRWQLCQTLGEAATLRALSILLDLAGSSDSTDLRRFALHEIGRIGDITWGERYHEELSPSLEIAWRRESNDQQLVSALSMALAKVGAASGVRLLIEEVEHAGRTLDEYEARATDKAWIAFSALEQVRNPAAVPSLELILSQNAPGSTSNAAAGFALSSMGQPDATKAILRWAQAANMDVGPLIFDWLIKMRDVGSVALVETALKEARFASSENKDALERTFSTWRSQRRN